MDGELVVHLPNQQTNAPTNEPTKARGSRNRRLSPVSDLPTASTMRRRACLSLHRERQRWHKVTLFAAAVAAAAAAVAFSLPCQAAPSPLLPESPIHAFYSTFRSSVREWDKLAVLIRFSRQSAAPPGATSTSNVVVSSHVNED